MSKKYDIAIVGVTGAVGETMLQILHQRQFPIGKLYALASQRSAGDSIDFGDQAYRVEDVADFDFSQVQLALFSAGAEVSAQYAKKAAHAGCIVIDNTSHFRYDIDVPLVIPEVNPEKIQDYTESNIIANPNCSTIQMLVALKPIYDAVGIDRINVATYQSVSGSGKAGITELAQQTGELLNGRPAQVSAYPKQIAFNLLPQIDVFLDNGYTKEEMKMVWETKKILADEAIQVNPTAVRVPVFYGHAEALHIETKQKLTADAARKLLQQASGIIVSDAKTLTDYPTPVIEGSGEDAVYVGRIRTDISHPHGLNLWVVADNVRKGAALNAIQIAEIVVERYL